MVVGDCVVLSSGSHHPHHTVAEPAFAQTAPVAPASSSSPAAIPTVTSLLADHNYVIPTSGDTNTQILNDYDTDNVQHQVESLQQPLGSHILENDGHMIMGDQDVGDDDGPWGDESDFGGEESDGLSMVSSITDRHSPAPTIPNGMDISTNSQLGGVLISDFSDSEVTSIEEGEYDFGYTSLPGDIETQTPVPQQQQQQLCLTSATVTGFTTEKGKRKQFFLQQQTQHQLHKQQNGGGGHHQQFNGGSPIPNGGSPIPNGGSPSASGGGLPDIVFIVELKWSDGRVNVVTRTYTDFCRLQYYLINEFVDVPANESPARLNIYLPVRRDVLPEDSFAQAHAEPQDSILLAESRELLLNQYVQELIKLPPKISASPTALTFFESRNSDPVPYHETVDTSRVNVTDQYILCWI